MSFLRDYKITIISGLIVLVMGVLVRLTQFRQTNKIIEINLAKDSVIHVITADNRNLEFKLMEKDSVLYVFFAKDITQTIEISQKDQALASASRKEKSLALKIKNLEIIVDSLSTYINSLEHVVVPK